MPGRDINPPEMAEALQKIIAALDAALEKTKQNKGSE